MKRSRLLFKSAVTALVCVVSAAQAQTPWIDNGGNWHDAPPSFTLACRGPLDIEVSMTASPPITMRFTRGHKPATSGVDVGTCAWIDRGVSAAEPDCLQDYANDVSIRISSHPGTATLSTGGVRTTVGAVSAIRQNTAAQSLEQIVQEQTAQSPAPAPATVTGSSLRAPYIAFIATSSDPIAYFRAFAIPGRACLFVERVGP